MFSLQPYSYQLGRTGLFARLYVKFSCVFVSFPRGVLSQVWCLIVLIPDLCILTYLVTSWVYVSGLFVIVGSLARVQTYVQANAKVSYNIHEKGVFRPIPVHSLN